MQNCSKHSLSFFVLIAIGWSLSCARFIIVSTSDNKHIASFNLPLEMKAVANSNIVSKRSMWSGQLGRFTLLLLNPFYFVSSLPNLYAIHPNGLPVKSLIAISEHTLNSVALLQSHLLSFVGKLSCCSLWSASVLGCQWSLWWFFQYTLIDFYHFSEIILLL